MSFAVLGEALIDFIQGDEGSYRPHLGGSPYNVAIGLARQGIDVSYVSPLSDDSFGDKLEQSLRSEGVKLPVRRRSLWPTSLALVTIGGGGQPAYRLYREGIADKDTSFEEIAAHLPHNIQVFHTGSLALTPSQLPTIRKVLRLLHDRGVLVSIDVNIRLRASIDERRYLDGVWSLLEDADIVKASDEDLLAFQLDPDVRKSADIAFKRMGSGLLVLTEGTGGALLLGDGESISKRAYPVAALADTVGAGDTFHSAFLASLHRSGELAKSIDGLRTETLESALDFACAAAAINVSRKGCSPPTAEEVSRFVAASAR
ncbi:MAG: carbohydrate kinase [Pseudomonadota bacterium]